MTLPTTTGPRILPAHHFGAAAGGRPPQSTVQDYFRMLGISASVATLPVPMLTAEMEKEAKRLVDAEPEIAAIYRDFSDELQALSRALDRENGARELPLGAFNPRVLEVSVSL